MDGMTVASLNYRTKEAKTRGTKNGGPAGLHTRRYPVQRRCHEASRVCENRSRRASVFRPETARRESLGEISAGRCPVVRFLQRQVRGVGHVELPFSVAGPVP